jgi:hypothetical protein
MKALMVVHNFHVFGAVVSPNDTETVLIFDPDAVLPFPVPAQRFQVVAGDGA